MNGFIEVETSGSNVLNHGLSNNGLTGVAPCKATGLKITSARLGYEETLHTAEWLLSRTKHKPEIGIICGSGLGGLADVVEDAEVFDYKDIPNFPISTVPGHEEKLVLLSVPGHEGKLVFGKLGGKTCVCMKGRFHYYEGYPLWKVTFPVRVMKLMGVGTLVATNACGGLDPSYKVGDVMIMKDHVNLMGLAGFGPLVGPHDERFGPRFPPTSGCYDGELRKLAWKVSKDLGYDFFQEGVYSLQGGPAFESIAESRFIRMLGANVTGMSTVPEVTVAKQCGLRCFGISLVTNMCITEYDTDVVANHEEVLETGRMRATDLQNFMTKFVEEMILK